MEPRNRRIIDPDALRRNMERIRSIVPDTAAVMAVVCLEALHYVMRSSDRHQMRIHFTAGTEAAVQSVLQRFSRDLDSYSIEREDGAFRGTITLRINTRDYAGLFLTATRDLEGITLDKIEPVEE